MATIRTRRGKRGTTYQAIVRIRGASPQAKTFRRKTDAKRWARSIEAAIAEGRFTTSEANRRTVAELLDRFVAEKIPLRAPESQTKLTHRLEWWKKKLGANTTLAEVAPARLVEIRDGLSRGESPSRRPVAPATVNRHLALVARAFSVAVKEWFWLEDNPFRRVPRLKEPRGRVRFLDDEERVRLLKTCQQSGEPRLYPLVLLALSTGARQGSLMKLRWPDIDFERGSVVFHETKNGDRISVPITGPAFDMMRELSRVRRLDTDLVFTNQWRRARFPREAWERTVAAAGISDFTFHDLRHTAASYLAMSGATLTEIADVLGHKTLVMVKRYSHLTEAHTRSVLSRMTAKLA